MIDLPDIFEGRAIVTGHDITYTLSVFRHCNTDSSEMSTILTNSSNFQTKNFYHATRIDASTRPTAIKFVQQFKLFA